MKDKPRKTKEVSSMCDISDAILNPTPQSDQVFYLHGTWQIIVNGKLIDAHWQDKGAALAGLQVEKRRAIRKEIKK